MQRTAFGPLVSFIWTECNILLTGFQNLSLQRKQYNDWNIECNQFIGLEEQHLLMISEKGGREKTAYEEVLSTY